MKRLFFLVATMAMLLCLGSSASPAASLGDAGGQPGIQTTKWLARGQSDITLTSDRKIIMDGLSEADQIVDRIWVRSYLQRWTGSSWSNIDSAYNYEDNWYYVTVRKTIPVSPGQYRVRSEHQVIHNGIKDPNPPYVSYSRTVTVN